MSSLLTEHFSIREVMASSVARAHKIDNAPPEVLMPAIRRTAAGLERIRALLGGHQLMIQSWYRCEALNRIVGGAQDSQHCLGEAVDFVVPTFGRPRPTALILAPLARELGIDQLILEPSWIHVSFAGVARVECLTAALENGRMVYSRGIG